MIEVRSSYLVKMRDVNAATELWQHGRDSVWPALNWSGRIQSMLHGHAQQSLFVWSGQWASLAEWEAAMARTRDSREYQDWSEEMNKLRVFGSEREVFSVLEPALPLDATPGKVEVRSAYLIQIQQVRRAQEHLRKMQEDVWPSLNWGGQNQQMLHGKAAQSMFVWASVWDSVAAWELGMANTRSSEAFRSWWAEWKE